MLEESGNVVQRVEDRLALLNEEIAAIRRLRYDPEANLKATIETQGKTITALMEIVGMLAVEIERLRHPPPPS